MRLVSFVILFFIIPNSAAWYPCPFNDGNFTKVVAEDVIIRAECTYLTSPLEWEDWNPNTFDGSFYNRTHSIPVVNLHLKRFFFTDLPLKNTSNPVHIINYWLVNGGGGSQYGMEVFGVSTMREIARNTFQKMYSQSIPIVYLFQYRGAGLSQPSIHCYTAKTWIECARELIETTVPGSVNESLRIIHAMSNQNIAQDLQYQIQYALNESQPLAPTSTYIYGLSQGTAIIQYYVTMQSIKSQIQSINAIVLDGVMSIQSSDAFQNQIRSLNDRFYLYLSKCENDLNCQTAFRHVMGYDEDILTVAFTLETFFRINRTNPLCTTNLGLKSWDLLMVIANLGIESIAARPLAAILVARLSRCSFGDQRVLASALPIMISLAEKSLEQQLVDPPDAYPDDGNVLSITTIWSDFVGYRLEENFKNNPEFFNEFCVNSSVTNSFYFSPTGPMPVCRETQVSRYNYSIPPVFEDILYEKNPRFWAQFQVTPRTFLGIKGGVLLLNGDLDYNSPMQSAKLTQKNFDDAGIRTRLIEMKGLTHVTIVQSYTKTGGFSSTTCTDQIVVQLLYQIELDLFLSELDASCSSKENLIGIDWMYMNPTVNQTLFTLFGRSTVDYWDLN